MRAIRLYVNQKLAVNEEVRLDDKTRHHSTAVLRINKHSPLVLFNGDGYDYPGQPATFHRKSATVLITDRIRAKKESMLETHLVLGVSKSLHMDYAVQKTVEAGVTEIHPVITERTVTRFSGKSGVNRHPHWQNVIISACEQCGRATLPILHQTRDLGDMSPVSEDARGFVLDIQSSRTLAQSGCETLKKAWFVIGPEGGLTRCETNQVMERGFEAITLGPRTLRTETAALAAILGAQMLWGDLSVQHRHGPGYPAPA